MLISELKKKEWHVVAKGKGTKVFSGAKPECIKFIKSFDKASDEYVDLRLHDGDGREFDYHKNRYSREVQWPIPNRREG